VSTSFVVFLKTRILNQFGNRPRCLIVNWSMACERIIIAHILQSLSKVVGTHAVLDCKSIYIFVTDNISPLPNQCCFLNLCTKMHRRSDGKWQTTLNMGREGDDVIVEIKDFCGICPGLPDG
jgi:hypothetical protein